MEFSLFFFSFVTTGWRGRPPGVDQKHCLPETFVLFAVRNHRPAVGKLQGTVSARN
jgi:hypothetical protein